MANTKTWPDPDQHFGGQGRKDIQGVYLLSPSAQKPVEPGVVQQATTNVAVPSTASNQVVKATPGYLSGALVTSVPGSPVALNIYDNATTNSGTIIGTIPSTATVGTFWPFNMPALNGITAAKTANTPAVTLAYS